MNTEDSRARRDTDEVIRLGGRHLFQNYRPLPVAFDRGQGVRLRDLEGNEYLDFIGGIAVSTLGHAHPALVEAIREQAGRCLHVSNLFHIPEQAEAGRLLTETAGLDRAFFCNSGTEAVEAAVKLARRWGRERVGTDAPEIVVTEGAFHGRTLGALAATANPDYREPFEPLPGGFRRVPYDDLPAAREAMGPDTCAILVEPIQGERGVRVPSDDYLAGLEELAGEHGALLVLDEVQTGIGRTGADFAFQRHGIRPDAVTAAKGLGGGVPVGALLAREEAAAMLGPGHHASTFGGNPLAMAAVGAVLRTLGRSRLSERAAAMGERLRSGVEGLAAGGAPIHDVRGAGLLVGVDVGPPAGDVVRACLDRGLLVNAIGDDTIRLAPPLIVASAEVDLGVELLGHALADVGQGGTREPELDETSDESHRDDSQSYGNEKNNDE